MKVCGFLSPVRCATVLSVLLLALAPSLNAQTSAQALARPDLPLALVADDSALRAGLLDSLFSGAINEVADRQPSLRPIADGELVEFSISRREARLVLDINRRNGSAWSPVAQGSWRIYRELSGGAFDRAEFQPRSDPSCVAILLPAPNRDRSLLHLRVHGAYLRYAHPIPVPFERLIRLPLADIVRFAGTEAFARYFEVAPSDYRDIRMLTEGIRRELPSLSYTDDGAFDERGMPVFIANPERPQTGTAGVNCSGFAKWLVDGVIRGGKGEAWPRLAIAPLSQPTGTRGSSFSERYEDELDPFFGLDWVRNLAMAAGSALRGARGGKLGECEVNAASFSLIGDRDGEPMVSTGFVEDSGFPISVLEPLLYTLAREEPGWFYLASINDLRAKGDNARRHFHVAAFLPQFDELGRYTVAVFESAAETDLASFVARYPTAQVYLTRVPVERTFRP